MLTEPQLLTPGGPPAVGAEEAGDLSTALMPTPPSAPPMAMEGSLPGRPLEPAPAVISTWRRRTPLESITRSPMEGAPASGSGLVLELMCNHSRMTPESAPSPFTVRPMLPPPSWVMLLALRAQFAAAPA
ncbi:hypothetical protein DAT35_21180 [Vitiosangium sp. GDMCC 1.1324]|nr:hypothetical protein DAT35_21180 [Vitiosangium sp. GDMCC 1.1324]